MAIDFFDGSINPEQVNLDSVLARSTVSDMEHGDETYVPASFYWIDMSRNMWIDMNAPAYAGNELEEIIDDFDEELVRCIRINKAGISGFIIDASFSDISPDGSNWNRFDQKTGQGFDAEVERSAVIGWVGTEMELEMLGKVLEKQFGLELDECAIKLAFENMSNDDSDENQ